MCLCMFVLLFCRYISPTWADWTIIPGLNIVYDALYTGDLTLGSQFFDSIVANHTYAYLIDNSNGVYVCDGI